MWTRALVVVVALVPTLAWAQREQVAVRLLNEGATSHEVQVGYPLSGAMRLRVVRADNESVPVPGVTVEIGVDFPLCAPLQPCNLPPAELYGWFLVDGTRKTFVPVRADQEGWVEAPVFIAGHRAGTYAIYATIFVSFQPPDTPVDLIFNDLSERSRSIRIRQITPPDAARDPAGTWSFDRASGQGFVLHELPDGRFAGGWFTWSEGQHRWYVLDSCVEAACPADADTWLFNVSRVRGGAPFETRTTSSTVVGTMKLRLASCRSGSAELHVRDGEFVATTTLPVANLTPRACE